MKLKSLTLILAVALGTHVAFAQQSKSDPSVEFNPHWFGQIQGGAGYTIGETAFKDLISPAGALSFGYQFNPTLGLRFGASGWQGKGNVVSPLEVYKFNYVQGNVDLVIDLANLVAYDHQRFFNPYIFAGAGAAYGFNNGAASITSNRLPFCRCMSVSFFSKGRKIPFTACSLYTAETSIPLIPTLYLIIAFYPVNLENSFLS